MQDNRTDVEKVVDNANDIRSNLKTDESIVRGYVDQIKSAEEAEGFDKGECIAQAMLALRHIEDARMRVGKVIQYATGGVSNFDKK